MPAHAARPGPSTPARGRWRGAVALCAALSSAGCSVAFTRPTPRARSMFAGPTCSGYALTGLDLTGAAVASYVAFDAHLRECGEDVGGSCNRAKDHDTLVFGAVAAALLVSSLYGVTATTVCHRRNRGPSL